VEVNGIVQGVEFRPFIYQPANQYKINGEVANTSSGVSIHIEGTRQNIESFCRDLAEKSPPLAHIIEIFFYDGPFNDYQDFTIVDSKEQAVMNTLISPDVSVCNDCLSELFDPNGRF
jgi:hydrogenase maturation protein HypF